MLVGEKSAQQIHVKQEIVFFSLLGKKCHITSLLKFIIMTHTHTKEKNKAIKILNDTTLERKWYFQDITYRKKKKSQNTHSFQLHIEHSLG